jgi:hypothetical protein
MRLTTEAIRETIATAQEPPPVDIRAGYAKLSRMKP